MDRMNRYLRVGLQPGLFGNEYTAILNVRGREVSSVIPKEQVRVEREPSQGVSGSGLLGVHVVEESTEDAVVDLPSPAFTSEPRLRVPVNDLVGE